MCGCVVYCDGVSVVVVVVCDEYMVVLIVFNMCCLFVVGLYIIVDSVVNVGDCVYGGCVCVLCIWCVVVL